MSWLTSRENPVYNVVLVHGVSLLTRKHQVGSILKQLILHAAECLNNHFLHLLLFSVSDGHEGGEELTLFLTGVLQPAWCYLQVSLHVKGLR